MNRNWRLLWTASTATTLADGAMLAALPLLATSMTSDPRLIAGVTAWGTLPWLLSSLPAGAIVDRADPKRAMQRVQLAQAGLIALLALLTLWHAGGMAALYAIAFALGVTATFAKVAVMKLIPAVVAPERLEHANGRQNASIFTVKHFAGPPIGAALFAVSASLPFWLAFAATAVAILLTARLAVTVKSVHSGRPLRADVAEGVRWLARHRLLRTLSLLSGMGNLANFMTSATLVLFAQDILGLSPAGYGILVATMAIGGIAGSFAAPSVVARFGGRATVVSTLAATPLAMLGIGLLARDLLTVVAFSFVSSFGASLWNVASISLRQREVPGALLGRVSSAGLMLSWGAQPIGAILGGLIAASPLGLTGPWIVAAALRLITGLVALPALRTWPTPPESGLGRLETNPARA